jgi:hypothetical protein
MIQAASQAFPVTAGVKNAAEAPWGLFVAPYHAPALADAAEECLRRGPLARCADCGAYLSPHVEFDRRRWKCALCGVWNGTAATRALEDKIGRRATTRNAKTALEELRHDLVECVDRPLLLLLLLLLFLLLSLLRSLFSRPTLHFACRLPPRA